MGRLLLSLQSALLVNCFLLSVAASNKCIDGERHALLKFKDNLQDNEGYLSSWGNDEERKDCCQWDGIECNNITGHVIILDLFDLGLSARGMYTSPPLIELRYLKHLNLRNNNLSGNKVASLIGNTNMVSLQSLDLSRTKIGGSIPESFGRNTTPISYLDLSSNSLKGPIPNSLGNMSLLTHLDLSSNSLKGSIPISLGNMTLLTHLDLSSNSLKGSIPISFGNPTLLTHLDLNSNSLKGSIPISLGNPTLLTHLDLSYNSFTGIISPVFFANFASISYLDLSYNSLKGCIPNSLGNMTLLTHLDLSNNSLQGSIPESLGNMSVLEQLLLINNNLEGEIPKSIWNICTLRELNMDSNNLSGDLSTPPSYTCTNHSLQWLDLSGNQIMRNFPDLAIFPSLELLRLQSNQIHGSLHPSIGQLSQLWVLDISDNLLEGVISEDHFLKLSNLRYLDLSSNKLIFNVSSAWLPPFHLKTISLGSCKLGPEFPNWLRTQVNYSHLDISNAAISDSIPPWFWNTTHGFLTMINASNNQLSGRIEDISLLNFRVFAEVDFSFNQLEGSVPLSFFKVTSLYLAGNKFTDLDYLCDIKDRAGLISLDISFNQLSGTLPDCWSSFDSLAVLNLAHNYNLSGKLPTSIGSLVSLNALHLGNNNFIGGLPSSLKNCSRLVVIDVGHNNLSGPIPNWIGENLTQLAILVLRSNHFNGSIPSSVCRLQSLQLLDLSMNHISGSLPKCVGNFSVMSMVGGVVATIQYLISVPTHANNSNFLIQKDDKMEVVWKGMVYEFGRTLGLVKCIDLSSNMMNGEIPSEITRLVGLVSLNLSRNHLSGQIPDRVGNMGQLDALDLSSNHFSGSIPQSLALIHGVGVLNVSNNNLSGKIPKGTQLQSFDASSYMGNPGLCGDPLPNKCPGEEPQPPPPPPGFNEEEEEEEDTDKFIDSEFYASMGVGFAVGFLGVFGTILYNRSCRFAYFKVLNDLGNWIYVVAAIYKAKFVNMLGG